MRIFNRTKFKKIRVFHNPKALDFDYTVLLIDTDNKFWYKRSIYNYVTFEDRIKISWLETAGDDVSHMDIEKFLKPEFVPDDIQSEQIEHEIEYINWINEPSKKHFKEIIELALDYVSENREYEIFSDYIFDFDFGLFLKDEYGDYETKQFFPELFNVIILRIIGFDDINLVNSELKKAKSFLRKNFEKILNIIHDDYLQSRNEQSEYLSEKELELSCPKIEGIYDLIDHIKFNTLHLYLGEDGKVDMSLRCETKWDEEHGIEFLINSDGKITKE